MQAIAFGAGVMILMMASIFIVGSAALLRDRDKDGFIGMGFGLAFVWLGAALVFKALTW